MVQDVQDAAIRGVALDAARGEVQDVQDAAIRGVVQDAAPDEVRDVVAAAQGEAQDEARAVAQAVVQGATQDEGAVRDAVLDAVLDAAPGEALDAQAARGDQAVPVAQGDRVFPDARGGPGVGRVPRVTTSIRGTRPVSELVVSCASPFTWDRVQLLEQKRCR